MLEIVLEILPDKRALSRLYRSRDSRIGTPIEARVMVLRGPETMTTEAFKELESVR